ncbi:hypothetical protein AAG570_010329 [Ranatra chinensis]|uniref:TNase-like domain-containing protein n=1 Tax=Ranatra chinensis TaxID=642074 RepID=A0ABD0ZAK3_9HEMI
MAIYSVALGGLALALRSVRPFKKFKTPSEIPAEFFEKHIRLTGRVLRVDFGPKPYLLVDHSPVIGSRYRELGPGLPLNIEGIEITGNGVSWLQTVVVGELVRFTLLELQPNAVGCMVARVKKDNTNLGNALVRRGFASVAPFNHHLASDALYCKYYQSLLRDEARAERDRNGIWWDSDPTIRSRIVQVLFDKVPSLRLRI